MISPKKRRILAVAVFLLCLYVLHLKMTQPYEDIARLEDEIYELKRRNVLRSLREQTLNNAAETTGPLPSSTILSSNGVSSQIQLPSILDIYPHLLETKALESLNPDLRYPDKQWPKKELIMGIPTIHRGNVSYLVPTLEQLLQKASTEDLAKIRIIVMIADIKGASSKFVQETLAVLEERFNDHFESGLLQVIVPPPAWYPDISALAPTFNDKPDRMYWRTKQNLDYAYLMIYAARMGNLYLQLEDDIEAAADYTDTILKHADRTDWFILELSTLGYIGKLMRSSDIPSLAVHVLINYQYKPIDWLLYDYCTNRYCSPEMAAKTCAKEVAKHRKQIRPAMFQHVGYYSSLQGKIQKLKDKTFKKSTGRAIAYRGSSGNPSAKITSTIAVYKEYTIESMYAGSSLAWLIELQKEDKIWIDFTLPKNITKITIKTGSIDHKEDIFTEETVLVASNVGSEKEIELARFAANGTLSYSAATPVSVEKLIIRVEKTLLHWVIVDQIKIEYEH